jgi:hypothetical protein
MKILLFIFLFTITLCYSQNKIVEIPDLKLQIRQTDSNHIIISHDLFELSLSKHSDTLNSIELSLYDSKFRYVKEDEDTMPNAISSQSPGWSITKTTTYYDLNGDTEFDFIAKLGHNRKPGDLGRNEEEDYIIYLDRIIKLRAPIYLKVGILRSDVTAIDGHVYRMTPKGWVLIK